MAKILRLYTRLPPLPGGMEKHISQLSQEQRKLGHGVSIFFNHGEKVSDADVRVSNIPLWRIKPQSIAILLFHIFVIFKLILRREQFDIVHIHGDWSGLILASLIKSFAQAKKVFLSVHDEIIDRKLTNFFFKILLNRVDIVFATGAKACGQLQELTDKKVVLQPSGINNIYITECEKLTKSGKQILTVANLVESKNLDLVLDVAKKLPNINFLIAGDGPERDRLINRIHNEKIDNIKILGYKKDFELWQLYCASDIFLLTSTREGTPTVILEAMACGLPIVSTDAGGIDNIVGENNCVTSSRNKDQLIACINKIIADSKLRAKITRENKIFGRGCSWPIVVKNINHFFT